MRHIFVTHKHVDHLMGIIWMVRMIWKLRAVNRALEEVSVTEFDKEIALIEKMGLKTSPLRLEYEKKCTNCRVFRRSLRQKDIAKNRYYGSYTFHLPRYATMADKCDHAKRGIMQQIGTAGDSFTPFLLLYK